MIKLKTIKFKKLSGTLKNLPRFLAERGFLFFLGLFFLALLLGSIIFCYSYLFLKEIPDEAVNQEKLLKINMKSQEKVFEEWQKRNKIFYGLETKEYTDLFR